MNKKEREEWLLKLYRLIEKLAKELHQMEEQKQTNIPEYKEKLKFYISKVLIYEEAYKKHEMLVKEKQSS